CGRRKRLADLAQDLPLADDHRVDTGGNTVEVPHCGLVLVDIESRAVQIYTLKAREQAHQVGGSVGGDEARSVKLGTVAGGNEDGGIELLAQAMQRLFHLGAAEG